MKPQRRSRRECSGTANAEYAKSVCDGIQQVGHNGRVVPDAPVLEAVNETAGRAEHVEDGDHSIQRVPAETVRTVQGLRPRSRALWTTVGAAYPWEAVKAAGTHLYSEYTATETAIRVKETNQAATEG